jgi:hypothetical protein
MLHNCSSVGSPCLVLVKVKVRLSVQDFEGCQASGHHPCNVGLQAVDHPPGVPVLKVGYSRYSQRFAEIEPAF